MKNMIFLFLLFCTQSMANEMEFELTGNGGNCAGCEWIEARGVITTDTPKKLENFLQEYDVSYPSINLHSPGGNLIAGIETGKILRKYKASVTIDSADGKAKCASACAYAFLGGATRYAEAGELGFHQFYDQKSMADFKKKQFTGEDRFLDQILTGIIVEYLAEVNASLDLYPLISKTHPGGIYWLTDADLEKYSINTSEGETTEWDLIVMKDGLAAVTKSKEIESREVRVFCTDNGEKHYALYIIPEKYYKNTYDYIVDFNSKASLISFDTDSKSNIHTKILKIDKIDKTDNDTIVLFILDKKGAMDILEAKSIYFNSHDIPRYLEPILNIFSFSNIKGNSKLAKFSLKNCI